MHMPAIEALDERLASLERECRDLRRENRRWRGGGLLIAMICAGGLLVGAKPRGDLPGTIEAERFVIKGPDGKVHAELGLYKGEDGRTTGATRLAFYDGEGGLRTNYGVGSNHDPYLHLIDQDGRILGSLSMSEQGWTNLSFTDKAGKTAVSLGSSDASGLVLRGPDPDGGLPRHQGALLVTEEGSAMLHFFRPGTARGDDRHERIHLGVRNDGTPVSILRGQAYDGGLRAVVPPDGKARITLDGLDLW